MRILHLLSSDRFSGAENVVCQIIGVLRDDPTLEMLYCSPDGEIAETLRERGIPFVPLRSMSVREVRRALREQRIDVLHAHDMRASLIGALAAPRRVKLISHIHNNATDARRLSVRSLTYLYAARRAKRILWVSDSAKDDYRFSRLVAKKSEVLYNIVDKNALIAAAEAEEGAAFDIVFLGRLTPVKDPLRLIRILGRVRDAVPEVRCALIGKGELEDEVRALIASLDLTENVTLLGFKKNPYPYLARAKVMVMTSVYEGMPMAALEAASLGVPIVGTPVDGLLSLIREGEGGYLSADDETLAAHLARIVTDDALQARMSAHQSAVAEVRCNTAVYRERLLAVLRAACPQAMTPTDNVPPPAERSL